MKLLCLVLSAWLWQDTQQKNIQHRIANGKEVSIIDFPYQVGLLSTNDFNHTRCGGALISTEHILTAAHCLDDMQKVTVLLGSARFDTNTLQNGVSKDGKPFPNCKTCWVAYPKWSPVSNKLYDYDIAIITLPYKVNLSSSVQPISLPKKSDLKKDMLNKQAVVSGWGRTETLKDSETLKAENITLTDHLLCYKDDKLCEARKNNKSFCIGDSGNPLILDKKVIGIVSIIRNFQNSDDESLVSIYTSVAAYLDWIHEVTKIPIED